MIKSVIFDMDDTLLNSSGFSYNKHSFVAKLLGYNPITEEEFFEHWGKPWKMMIKGAFPDADLELFVKTYNYHLFSRSHKPIHIDIDTHLKKYAEKGIILGIVSTRPESSMSYPEFPVDLSCFAFVHGEESTQFYKPDPRVFDKSKEILASKNISEKETLYVGDLVLDYMAANGAGLHFAAVLTGIDSRKPFNDVGLDDRLIHDSVLEIYPFLESVGWKL